MNPSLLGGAVAPAVRAAGAAIGLLASVLLAVSLQAADFQSCPECHRDTLEEDAGRSRLHAPFQEGRCAPCHAWSEAAPPSREVRVANAGNQERIRWLGDSTTADTEHWFAVPGESAGEVLVVEARGKGVAPARREISLPPLGVLPEVEDPGALPALSALEVLGVERGLVVSATIGWETDSVTDAVVRYGEGALDQATSSGSRLGRRHRVVLYGLKPNKEYVFSAVSRDLLGRQQMSAPLRFSTAKPRVASIPVAAGEARDAGPAVGINSRLRRRGNDYVVALTAEQPVWVALGTKGAVVMQASAARSEEALPLPDEVHAGLSGKLVTSVEACRACHTGRSGSSSHPVNVYPTPGMVVPADYPTLPDGRITCTSCHEAHAANHEYNLIKPQGRELCVGCHRNMR